MRMWRDEWVYDQQLLGISWSALLKGIVCWRLETGVDLQLLIIFYHSTNNIIWIYNLTITLKSRCVIAKYWKRNEQIRTKNPHRSRVSVVLLNSFPWNQPSETLSCDISFNCSRADANFYKQDESANYNVINRCHYSTLWNHVHQI